MSEKGPRRKDCRRKSSANRVFETAVEMDEEEVAVVEEQICKSQPFSLFLVT